MATCCDIGVALEQLTAILKQTALRRSYGVYRHRWLIYLGTCLIVRVSRSALPTRRVHRHMLYRHFHDYRIGDLHNNGDYWQR